MYAARNVPGHEPAEAGETLEPDLRVDLRLTGNRAAAGL